MGKNQQQHDFLDILCTRERFFDADHELGDALQRFLIDPTGTNEESLLAFIKQQNTFHAYSSEILARIGLLRGRAGQHKSPSGGEVRRADIGR